MSETMRSLVEEHRADQLLELAELKAELVVAKTRLSPVDYIELALKIMDRAIKILGTSAPQLMGLSVKGSENNNITVTFVDPDPEVIAPGRPLPELPEYREQKALPEPKEDVMEELRRMRAERDQE